MWFITTCLHRGSSLVSLCVCGMPFYMYMFLVFHNQAGISTVAQNSVISWKITLMLMLTLTQLTNF